MFCVKCGSQLQANARFCATCGTDNSTYAPGAVSLPAPVPTFIEKPEFCVKCGAELYPKTRVCPNCQFDNTGYIAAPPQAQQFQASPGLLYPGAYCEGNVLVVPRNATLPASCVKCGGTPKERWYKKTFYWHNPLIYLIALLSPLIYVIVAVIVRKNVPLVVPICDQHDSSRKVKLWIGALLLLGFLPLPIALGVSWQSDYAPGVAVLLGLVMFFGGLIMIWLSYPLRPTYIGDDCAKFKGAHPEFLARLRLGTPAAPGMGVQTRSAGI